MPIYAYHCAACGFTQDILQKMSDAALTVCPSCHQERFAKQVTAAGFQLKGSGWYVTDFRNNAAAKPATTTSKEEGAAKTSDTPEPAVASAAEVSKATPESAAVAPT